MKGAAAAINLSATAFYNFLIEIVGYKCGIALTRAELRQILIENQYAEYAFRHARGGVRIHSVDMEDIIYDLMKHFGRLAKDFSRFPTIDMFHKYKHDPKLSAIYQAVMEIWIEHAEADLRQRTPDNKEPIDPTPAMMKVFDQYGQQGLDLLMETLQGLHAAMMASPWGDLREVEWRSALELKQLFDSEGLNAQYGNFFDRHFADVSQHQRRADR